MSGTSRRLAVATLITFGVGSLGTQVDVAAQEPPIVRGGANASADSMGFQIINAGASLGWIFGRSTAAYRDVTATSEGKAVDLGAVEALFGQPQCGGEVPPVLNLATLPPRTIADSTAQGSEVAKTAQAIYPRLADDKAKDRLVGTQTASATKAPSSQSSTTTLNQDFGFFRVEGATTSTRTSFTNGVRLAEATTSAKRLVVFGGQIVFHNPTWRAKAWSGADKGAEAGFTFSSAQVFGNWVSGAALERDLKVFETLIEGVLSPFGLDLRYPEVRQPFGATGIEVTPLTFSMSNAPIGRDLLIPLLNTDLLKNYRIDSVSEDCKRETFWTMIDAIERALGGSGSIDTVVGGAIATTDDTDYSVKPFGDPGSIPAPAPVTGPPAQVPTDFGAGAGTGDFGGGYTTEDFDTGYNDDLGLGLGDYSDLDTGSDTGAEEPPTEVLAADKARSADSGAKREDGREIAAGATDGGEGSAAATVVGVLALLGALGMSMGDRIMGLRARRRIT